MVFYAYLNSSYSVPQSHLSLGFVVTIFDSFLTSRYLSPYQPQNTPAHFTSLWWLLQFDSCKIWEHAWQCSEMWQGSVSWGVKHVKECTCPSLPSKWVQLHPLNSRAHLFTTNSSVCSWHSNSGWLAVSAGESRGLEWKSCLPSKVRVTAGIWRQNKAAARKLLLLPSYEREAGEKGPKHPGLLDLFSHIQLIRVTAFNFSMCSLLQKVAYFCNHYTKRNPNNPQNTPNYTDKKHWKTNERYATWEKAQSGYTDKKFLIISFISLSPFSY